MAPSEVNIDALRILVRADRLPTSLVDLIVSLDMTNPALTLPWVRLLAHPDVTDAQFAALAAMDVIPPGLRTDDQRTELIRTAAAIRAVRAGASPQDVVAGVLDTSDGRDHGRNLVLVQVPWDGAVRAFVREYVTRSEPAPVASLAQQLAARYAWRATNWEMIRMCLDELDGRMCATPKDSDVAGAASGATASIFSRLGEQTEVSVQGWVTAVHSPRLALAAMSAVGTADGLREHGPWMAAAFVEQVLVPVLRRETIGSLAYSQVSNLLRRLLPYFDRPLCELVLAEVAAVPQVPATVKMRAGVTGMITERRRRAPRDPGDLGAVPFVQAARQSHISTANWMCAAAPFTDAAGWSTFLTMLTLMPDAPMEDVIAAAGGVTGQ